MYLQVLKFQQSAEEEYYLPFNRNLQNVLNPYSGQAMDMNIPISGFITLKLELIPENLPLVKQRKYTSS